MMQLMLDGGRFFLLRDDEEPDDVMQPAVAGMKASHPDGDGQLSYELKLGRLKSKREAEQANWSPQ